MRKSLVAAASMTVVLMLAGCSAPTDGGEQTLGDEPITNDEIAAGEAFTGSEETAEPGDDHAEHVEESSLTIASEDESSAPYLDESPIMDTDATDDDVEPLSPEDINQTTACKRATGYRRGKAFTICVTTVDGKLVEVNTARAYLRMKRAAKNRGIYLWVNSGFRTMAQQRYFWNCYKTKRCNGGNLAAPPGYSNHQSGKALDLNTSARGVYGFLSRYGKNYGFRRTVPSEKWHWER